MGGGAENERKKNKERKNEAMVKKKTEKIKKNKRK